MKDDVRCSRCRSYRRRSSNPFHWNEDYIAGLVIGYQCPDCQTAEENLGAEVNLVLNPPDTHRALKMDAHDNRVKFIYGLIDAYPTPEVMRAKADTLAAARQDEQASEVVRLMRTIADDMESGELYEDEP